MNALRSVVAVFVSWSLVYCLVYLGDSALAWLFHQPPMPADLRQSIAHPLTFILLSTIIYAAATIIGGWTCILWAPVHPRLHLFLLFVLGEAVGIFLAVGMWATHPHWIALVWLAIWPFCLWIGGIALVDHPTNTLPPPRR
jgi:hypothetical protein